MNVESSPPVILIVPVSRCSLPSRARPVPDFWSYSHAPVHVNEMPPRVNRASTCARRQCIRSRSPRPVNEINAGPRSSRPSLAHVPVSMIRHQPAYSGAMSSEGMVAASLPASEPYVGVLSTACLIEIPPSDCSPKSRSEDGPFFESGGGPFLESAEELWADTRYPPLHVY